MNIIITNKGSVFKATTDNAEVFNLESQTPEAAIAEVYLMGFLNVTII